MRLENLVDLWKYKSFLDKTTKDNHKISKRKSSPYKQNINLDIYNMKLNEDLIDMI